PRRGLLGTGDIRRNRRRPRPGRCPAATGACLRTGHRAPAGHRQRARPAATGRRRDRGAPRHTYHRHPRSRRRRRPGPRAMAGARRRRPGRGSRTRRRHRGRRTGAGRDRIGFVTLNPSTACAQQIVTSLVAAGVRYIVLAPGSRSAPLAYALAAADEAGWCQVHVSVDERSAAFIALGLARQGPAAVVTTSGTAVANLHPAVLEAGHGHLPLVLVTADRPHQLRGVGANQTTDQVKIFGSTMRQAWEIPAGPEAASMAGQIVHRAVIAATGRRSRYPGPVHLNVGFADPLTPDELWQPGPPPHP